MDENTEIRLLVRIAQLEGKMAALYEAAARLVAQANIPAHVTAKSYSTSDTKRVPSRPLVTLRNIVRAMER